MTSCRLQKRLFDTLETMQNHYPLRKETADKILDGQTKCPAYIFLKTLISAKHRDLALSLSIP